MNCLTASSFAPAAAVSCAALSEQPLAAYEKFARICTHSLTLVGTRFYLSRSREHRRELREKQMELSASLLSRPRRRAGPRSAGGPVLPRSKSTRGNTHVTLNLVTA